MTVGFTPKVFTDFIKYGADKIIAIHSDNEHPKVRETIRELKTLVKDTKSVQVKYVTRGKTFLEIVQEVMRTITSETDSSDDIFVHIGGGERHMALALLYATFFCERKMQIVCTTRIKDGRTETLAFEHDVMPTMPVNLKLSKSQKEVMKALERGRPEWNGLTELAKIVGGRREQTMPRIHRHLKNLTGIGLVEKNAKTRKYRLTIPGRLALEAAAA